VQGSQRAIVTGVHRLEHIQNFASVTFSNNDPVRAHTQGIPHQVTDGYLAFTFKIGRLRLKTDIVFLL
jgi:hypothetical protein